MSGFLEMSDEDFLKMDSPPPPPDADTSTTAGEPGAPDAAAQEAATAEAARVAEEEAAAAEVKKAEDEAAAAAGADTTEAAAAAGADTTEGGKLQPTQSQEQVDTTAATPKTPAVDQPAKVAPGKESSGTDAAPGSGAPAAADTPDYKAVYDMLMSPIKADGGVINLKTPEEAMMLIKQGVNYTRKMQEMAPQRKLLLMLKNGGLEDEGKLSFAIDLVNKNPEALKKLIKDSGLDTMSFDPEAEIKYQEGNHRVSDVEAALVTAVEDLRGLPNGAETLNVMNAWDQASKDALWNDPSILQLIHEQRASGVYAQVAAEVDRQRILGHIPRHVPFLAAYQQVGDQLAKAGVFNKTAAPAAAPAPQVPVATTVQAPKPVVTNGAKVSAATATRASAKPASTAVNPLAMSDDEFMKLAVPR